MCPYAYEQKLFLDSRKDMEQHRTCLEGQTGVVGGM